MRSATTLAWLALMLAQVAGARAHACSPLYGYSLESMSPADGAVGVPLNAQVRLLYRGEPASVPSEAFEDVVLQTAGGAAAPASATTLRIAGAWTVTIRPAAPLLANTTYELLSASPTSCVPYTDCTLTARVLVGTFTTGDALDTTPPTFGGLEGFTSHVEICEGSACCGPYRGIRFSFSWAEGSDDTGVVAYRLYQDGVLIADPGASTAILICAGTQSYPMLKAGSGKYSMHAIDVAGNEDSNAATLEVSLDCADTIQRDGGLADSGAHDAGGRASQSKGCAAGSSSPTPLAGPGLLLAVMLAAPRVRRHRCQPPLPPSASICCISSFRM